MGKEALGISFISFVPSDIYTQFSRPLRTIPPTTLPSALDNSSGITTFIKAQAFPFKSKRGETLALKSLATKSKDFTVKSCAIKLKGNITKIMAKKIP